MTQLFHELDFAIKKRGDILKACTKNRIFFLLPDKIAKRFLSFSFLSRCAQRAGFNLLGRDSGECIRQDLRCLSLYCSKLYTGSVVDLSLFGKNLKIFHFSSGEIQNSLQYPWNKFDHLSNFPVARDAAEEDLRPARKFVRLRADIRATSPTDPSIPKEALDVFPFLFTQEGSGTRVIAGGSINSIRGESS